MDIRSSFRFRKHINVYIDSVSCAVRWNPTVLIVKMFLLAKHRNYFGIKSMFKGVCVWLLVEMLI